MSIFIRIEIDPRAQAVKSLVNMCPVNIFAERDGHVVVLDERQDECTLCELCLKASPPGAIRIGKLYSGEWLSSAAV